MKVIIQLGIKRSGNHGILNTTDVLPNELIGGSEINVVKGKKKWFLFPFYHN